MSKPLDEYHYQVGSLLAEVELGLTSARMAANADDQWLALRERAKANQAYAGVLQIKEQLAMPPDAQANLERRLDELRLAIRAVSGPDQACRTHSREANLPAPSDRVETVHASVRQDQPKMNPIPHRGDQRACVLIVDDEVQNRELLRVLLTAEGYVLQTATNGEEALALVAQQAPSLILLDVMMPGMDGYEVAKRIKSNPATKNIPVIMITALADRYSRMGGLDSGAEEFLTKPFDRAELSVRVRNLLRLTA